MSVAFTGANDLEDLRSWSARRASTQLVETDAAPDVAAFGRRVAVAALLAGTLSACGDLSPGPARDAQPAPPAATPAAPLDAPPLFAGAWAATPALCRGGAWTFSAEGVATAGGVSCRWTKVERRAGGWTLSGTCAAEGPPEAQTVSLALELGDPNAMTVAGGPWAGPQRLIRCGASSTASAVLDEAARLDARFEQGAGLRRTPFRYGPDAFEAWREEGRLVRVVQPADSGAATIRGETIWDFRPGAAEVFMVREPLATYMLERGRLSAWLDRDGRPVPASPRDREARAQDLLDRARVLRRAAGD
jgi:hypothetical protein